MKFSYVARQPILDQDKKTIAYELLFRDGPKNTFPEVEPELATSRLLSDQFLTAHYHSIEDKLGFVNFPYSSLVKLVPTLFPNKRIVVEILEDCPPNDELFRAVKALHSKGYTLALDDFIPAPEWKRFLPYISIIKFDIQIVPVAKAARFIQRLDGAILSSWQKRWKLTRNMNKPEPPVLPCSRAISSANQKYCSKKLSSPHF
jgi:EAL and modified HD-GYP domain-containing signal transduction protein